MYDEVLFFLGDFATNIILVHEDILLLRETCRVSEHLSAFCTGSSLLS
jgi:hypothetical protein